MTESSKNNQFSNIRVSVALITHNSARFLRPQIDSILLNLGANDEIVVSDDSSTDDTLAILKSYSSKDPRFRIFTSPTHLGPNGNAEKAYSLCQGEFIFHSDDDNVWLPGKVDDVLACFQSHPKASLVMHDAAIVSSDLTLILPSFFKWRHSKPGILHNVIRSSYGGSMMAFRSSLKRFILPFPENMPFFFDCWLGFMSDKHGHSVFLPKVLSDWRRHEGTASGNPSGPKGKKENRLALRWKIWQFVQKH
jgi:glycosyltransferase involved in cell wall biosynthesis